MNTVKIREVIEKIPDNTLEALVGSEELGFSVFVINSSKALHIKTFNQLINEFDHNSNKFRAIFGRKSIEEIREKIILKSATHLRVVRED